MSLRDVFENAAIGSDVNSFHLEKIKAGRETLEREAKAQKDVDQLIKDQFELNVTIDTITQPSRTSLSAKRRLEEYARVEEQAIKVLRTCRKLKGSKEE